MTDSPGTTTPGPTRPPPSRRADIRRALGAAVPIVLALVPLALVLGARAAEKGLSPVAVLMMTSLNLAGGSEFAAIDLWTSPVPVVLIVTTTFLINSRHLLMGAALAPWLGHLPRRIVYPSLFLLSDEAWAIALADAQQQRKAGHQPAFRLAFYLTFAASLWVAWFLAATAGAILGPVLGDLDRFGFALAFPAIFLVLLRGMWPGWRAARPWLVSLLVAATASLFLPGAWHVPLGAGAGLLFALFDHPPAQTESAPPAEARSGRG